MASILKLGNSWRVQIRRKGLPKIVKTFATCEEAEFFAHQSEHASRNCGLPGEISSLKRVKHDDFSGVYFLFKGDECVYVGQSNNVHARTLAHRRTFDFDEYAWLAVPRDQLDAVEQKYIRLISPSLNKIWNAKPEQNIGPDVASLLFSGKRNATNLLRDDLIKILSHYKSNTYKTS